MYITYTISTYLYIYDTYIYIYIYICFKFRKENKQIIVLFKHKLHGMFTMSSPTIGSYNPHTMCVV